MGMIIDNGNPHYEAGIPEKVTKCAMCFKELDLIKKHEKYIPWCNACRTNFIRQQERDYENKK